MTVPVLIEETDGQFEATLVGDATMRATAPTREGAINGLRVDLKGRVSRGEFAFISLTPDSGITGSAGIFANDETLDEMVREIYSQRDAGRPE